MLCLDPILVVYIQCVFVVIIAIATGSVISPQPAACGPKCALSVTEANGTGFQC